MEEIKPKGTRKESLKVTTCQKSPNAERKIQTIRVLMQEKKWKEFHLKFPRHLNGCFLNP